MDAPSSHAEHCARMIEAARVASLATLTDEGHPFASLVAVAFDSEGRGLLLLSRLAEHTKNLDLDPRASLLLTGPRAAARLLTGPRAAAPDDAAPSDPLAGGRVTLIGECRALEREADAEARRLFLAAHPEAAAYADFADFRMFVFTPCSLRYVGGFGRMSWVTADGVREALGGRAASP